MIEEPSAPLSPRVADRPAQSNRYRVLYLSPASHIGGEEISTLSLATGIAERGHLPAYAAASGPFLEEFEHAGVPVHRLPIDGRRPLSVWRGSRAIRRCLLRHQFDILHAQEVFPTVMAHLARRFPTPLRTSLIFHYRGVRKEMMPMVGRVIPRITDFIITNAETNRRRFTDRGADPRRVLTIYNGFDWGPYDQPPDRDAVRASLGVPTDVPLAVVVARLMPIKGHRYLIDAMPSVRERVPNARLAIIGDGPLRSELEARAEKLGVMDSVSFAGFRRDIPAILGAADLLVLPSVDEPFGRVLVEAHAARLPVVSTRVGGTVEILEDGASGHFVPPRDSDALAARVAEILSDPNRARAMGRRGREAVTSKFSLKTMVDSTLDVYRHLLDERGPR